MRAAASTALLLVLAACMSTSASLELVDGERVIEHVRRIVSFGPHPAGSEAQQEVGQYIIDHLEGAGLEVHKDEFERVTPLGRLAMSNIWAVLPGMTDRVIILASHYDSKYFEDFSFVGANDGGSSTALLLEMAPILASTTTRTHTVWLVFFDGEEAFREWTELDSLYGSRRFVEMLKQRGQLDHIAALILLDMVGEKDLVLRPEYNSTDWLIDIIWEEAARRGHARIFSRRGSVAAEDDHLPFAREQIPVVDIIDLDYAHWHRAGDTVDKLSAANLEAVGAVVLASLPRIESHLSSNP